MSSELMTIVNSGAMWVCSVILILLVVVQAGLYFRLCAKEARIINYDQKNLKKSFRLGMITAFGPALTNVVAMISMMTIIGSPITWMRLSIIGAAPTELGVAALTAQSLGLTLGNPGAFDVKAVSLIFLMMAITGTGWLLVVIFLTPSMGKIRIVFERRDVKWVSLFTAAATVGLFSNLSAQQLVKGGVGTYCCTIAAFVTMILTHNVLGKKYPLLKSYSMTISMVIGMAAGGIVAPNI
jgi:hypothetical protein